MNEWQRKVIEFHVAMEATIGGYPAIRDPELRAKLIMEEAVETVAALGFPAYASLARPDGSLVEFRIDDDAKPDIAEAIDGICDSIYVLVGTAISMGVDLDPHFDEVHRANMAKLGGGKRADGKVIKPLGWEPPDHKSILAGEHL